MAEGNVPGKLFTVPSIVFCILREKSPKPKRLLVKLRERSSVQPEKLERLPRLAGGWRPRVIQPAPVRRAMKTW
jgi:hypothetical protein